MLPVPIITKSREVISRVQIGAAVCLLQQNSRVDYRVRCTHLLTDYLEQELSKRVRTNNELLDTRNLIEAEQTRVLKEKMMTLEANLIGGSMLHLSMKKNYLMETASCLQLGINQEVGQEVSSRTRRKLITNYSKTQETTET
jgi:uncharacterized protein VirK/YbjX